MNLFKRPTVSIKTQISMVLAISLILTVGLTSLFSYILTSNKLEEAIFDQTNHVLMENAKAIDMYLSQVINNLDSFAENRQVKTYFSDPNSHKQMRIDFENYMISHQDLLAMYLGTPTTNQENKKVVIEPDSDLIGEDFDPSTRVWYQAAVEALETVVSEPYIDAVTGGAVITVSTPIKDIDGRFIGVLGMDISLDLLADRINQTKLWGASPFIIDQSGVNLTSPNKEERGQESQIPGLIKELLVKEKGQMTYHHYTALWYPIPNTQWKIVGTVPKTAITGKSLEVFRQTMLGFTGILLVFLLIGFWYSNRFALPLKALVEDLEVIGAGDFTAQSSVDSKNEIGTVALSLNKTIEAIKNLIRGSQGISKQVLDASSNLSLITEQSSKTYNETNLAVEEIAIGSANQTKEIYQSVVLIKKLEESFSQLITSTKEILASINIINAIKDTGMGVVKGLDSATLSNNTILEQTSDSFNSLNGKIEEIGLMLTTIATIANQTELLALNAAIEAARAGDLGKGFAVVAHEIGDLAETSQSATNKISSIIESVYDESNQTERLMERVQQSTTAQTHAIAKTLETFENIAKNIISIADQIENVSQLIHRVDLQKDQISHSLENILAISQETASSSEELAGATHEQLEAIAEIAQTAEQLSLLAKDLNQALVQFII